MSDNEPRVSDEVEDSARNTVDATNDLGRRAKDGADKARNTAKKIKNKSGKDPSFNNAKDPAESGYTPGNTENSFPKKGSDSVIPSHKPGEKGSYDPIDSAKSSGKAVNNIADKAKAAGDTMKKAGEAAKKAGDTMGEAGETANEAGAALGPVGSAAGSAANAVGQTGKAAGNTANVAGQTAGTGVSAGGKAAGGASNASKGANKNNNSKKHGVNNKKDLTKGVSDGMKGAADDIKDTKDKVKNQVKKKRKDRKKEKLNPLRRHFKRVLWGAAAGCLLFLFIAGGIAAVTPPKFFSMPKSTYKTVTEESVKAENKEKEKQKKKDLIETSKSSEKKSNWIKDAISYFFKKPKKDIKDMSGDELENEVVVMINDVETYVTDDVIEELTEAHDYEGVITVMKSAIDFYVDKYYNEKIMAWVNSQIEANGWDESLTYQSLYSCSNVFANIDYQSVIAAYSTYDDYYVKSQKNDGTDYLFSWADYRKKLDNIEWLNYSASTKTEDRYADIIIYKYKEVKKNISYSDYKNNLDDHTKECLIEIIKSYDSAISTTKKTISTLEKKSNLNPIEEKRLENAKTKLSDLQSALNIIRNKGYKKATKDMILSSYNPGKQTKTFYERVKDANGNDIIESRYNGEEYKNKSVYCKIYEEDSTFKGYYTMQWGYLTPQLEQIAYGDIDLTPVDTSPENILRLFGIEPEDKYSPTPGKVTKITNLQQYNNYKKTLVALSQKFNINMGTIGGGLLTAYGETYTEEQIKQMINAAGNISGNRKEVLKYAYSLCGRVMYEWGGGHGATPYNGIDPDWGKVIGDKVKGLDCSGYVSWVYHNAMFNEGTYNTVRCASNFTSFVRISNENAIPGDIGANDHHVGIYVGKNEKGEMLFAHAPATGQCVKITAYKNFTIYRDPTGVIEGSNYLTATYDPLKVSTVFGGSPGEVPAIASGGDLYVIAKTLRGEDNTCDDGYRACCEASCNLSIAKKKTLYQIVTNPNIMEAYKRIFTLKNLSPGEPTATNYQILQEAISGKRVFFGPNAAPQLVASWRAKGYKLKNSPTLIYFATIGDNDFYYEKNGAY